MYLSVSSYRFGKICFKRKVVNIFLPISFNICFGRLIDRFIKTNL